MNSYIEAPVKKQNITSTTDVTGFIPIAYLSERILLQITSPGYIVIPFHADVRWFAQVLTLSTLQPVANTEITLTLYYL